MHSILVVVDFNETSKNCALYALELAKKVSCKSVILYHRFQVLNVANPMAGFDQVSSEPYAKNSIEAFEAFKNSLGNIPTDINLKMYHGATELIESIEQMIEAVDADLVVMGIEHHNNWLKEKFAHEDGIDVAKVVKVPVILVPESYKFSKLEQIIFLSDFDKVDAKTPVESITHFLQTVNVNTLEIAHIDKHHNAQQQQVLEKLFGTIQVKFTLINDDFNNGLVGFINNKNVDLIMALAVETNMWHAMFNSHTKHLANITNVPLLLTHK
jgi:nucleotide-binding universal stress UspA family protein